MTTKKEQELLTEIETLKRKLENAEKWMTRQVEESAPFGSRFFSKLHPRKTFYDRLLNTLEKVRHFRLFRHHYTLTELWMKRVEAFFV